MSKCDISKTINDSRFVKKWKKEMISTMKQIHPDWDKDDISDVLDNMLKKQMQFPEVTLDNNYTGESRISNMVTVVDWMLDRKPLVAGNATFYKNQDEAINPIANMLDGFLTDRKNLKKSMFKIDDVFSDEYKSLDRSQGNKKRLANSYYGGSGMPKSAFYSKWSGPATTGTAQSVISTTETFFEGFLVDNYKFIDVNEAFHYMNEILKQDYEVENFLVPVSKDDLVNRMIGMFYDDIYIDEYEEPIRLFIENLCDKDVTKIYYKNNFEEFTLRHKNILDIYDILFSSVKNYEYADSVNDIPKDLIGSFIGDSDKKTIKAYNTYVNTQYFMDPNNPPESIKDTLSILKGYYVKYVYMPFMSVDRIHRLKYFSRKTVCIVDTDSNILNLDRIVNMFFNNVLASDYNRDAENNKFIIINTLAYFITATVTDTLDVYGKHSYIPDKFRPRFNMKNEFYFNKLVIGRKKKRYISSIKLREGNLITPYKADVKGFDYSKASTSEYANRRFSEIVKNNILESDIPDSSRILGDLRRFENDIRSSILSGETTYLPLGNAKDLAAYKDPYREQGVRGAIAWNIIYPDRTISYPSKVSILKLNIFTLDDIEDLKETDIDKYNVIKNEIFNSSIKALSAKGLQVLAIPGNEKIPEWVMPYIDMTTVINNILGQFKGVLDVFGISCPEVGKNINSVIRKTKKYSNVIRF